MSREDHLPVGRCCSDAINGCNFATHRGRPDDTNYAVDARYPRPCNGGHPFDTDLDRAGRVVVVTGTSSDIVRGAGVYAESGASFGDATRASAQPMHQANTMTTPRAAATGTRRRLVRPAATAALRGAHRPQRVIAPGGQLPYHRSVSDERSQETVASGVAEALRRRASDWAAGAEEGRELDRRIARRQSPQERLDSGRELVELAAKLRQRD
jgi:capsid protein